MENLAGVASGLSHPLFESRPEKTIGLVIVTASKGLCGSYNSALLRRAEAWLKDKPKENVRLFCVGRRGHDYFLKRGWTIAGYWPDVNDLSSAEAAGRVATAVIRAYRNEEVDAVWLLYTKFINAMSRTITLDKLLNIEPPAERPVSEITSSSPIRPPFWASCRNAMSPRASWPPSSNRRPRSTVRAWWPWARPRATPRI
jgi:ATP synthase F1 gamma subunit